VEKGGRRGAWFTARPSSTDVAALALGLARAAAEVVPECDVRLREHLRALPAPAEHVDVLAELLGEDLQRWPPDAWLVLDDYQEVMPSADAERFIEELVSAAPIQLLIASRQRPSWITARRILYGEILELNQTELAMDGHEAAEVMAERNAASASGLVALANGWPAVIGLASVSGAEIEDGESVPESLYQFFAEEVFNALDREVQEGLATLAIAPVIDRSLASILLADRAEAICNSGLDLGILVERGARFEIHPLARAFLEGRSEHSSVPADLEIIDRCLAFYREHGDWDAAFDLAVRYGRAVELELLLDDALDELLDTARLSTIENWCDHFAGKNATSAILSLGRAEIALRRGHLAAAQTHAEVVASLDPRLEFRAASIAGRAAHLESREEEALEFFRRAERSAPNESLRRDALWNQALCMSDLEMSEAIGVIDQLAADVGQDDPREIVRAAGCRAMCQVRFGSLDPAEAHRAAQLLPIVRDPIVETGFLSSYASVLLLTGQYSAAREIARALYETAQQYRLDFAVPWACSLLANSLTGLREWHEAETIFSDGLLASRRISNTQAEHQCLAGLMRALCQQGRHNAALAVAPAPSIAPQLPTPIRATRAELALSRALVLAALDRIDEASSITDPIRTHSRTTENTVLVAAIDAVVGLKRHDADAIERVKSLAEAAFSTGAVDLLIAAYRSAPELLAALLRLPSHCDDVGRLVQRVGDVDLADAVGQPIVYAGRSEALLTKRQRQVYELLRQGLSNREIAQLLVITEGTAKLHVQHIFDRLGVRSRKAIAMQAVLERSAQATSAIDETDGAPGS
jgi:ATP/maltotriose-dependent transcriptional regulator MalT